MNSLIASTIMTVPMLAASVVFNVADSYSQSDLGRGAESWRIVVDGVMGGRSSGRVSQNETGNLQFAGDLSLENNGGFSQMRTNVSGDDFAGARGIQINVRGDGRDYKFDVRCSNVRLMAGGFQQDFQTEAGKWTTIQLPFDDFRLYSFGRLVPNAPALEPARIESIGVTLADKKPGAFSLEIDSIRTFGDKPRAVESTNGSDLVTVARAAGLNTLLELVTAAELELPTDESVTIFAPTDAAFAALPEATVRALLEPAGRDTLRSILTYHVTTSAVRSSDVMSRRSISTLNGQRIAIDTSGPISIGGAGLVTVDVPFDGGIVHVIDTVLMPELKSIGEVAGESSQLTTLAAAVSVSGLSEQVSSENGPWTVFAPVDSAFANLPPGTLDELLQESNRSQLIDILGLHVIPGRLYANELLANRRAQTLFGNSVNFAIIEGRLQVGNATVITTDIEAANGVVHLIDTVLLPTREAEPIQTVSATASVEAIRLCELAISRGAPLFNTGQAAGCAAVYEVVIESMIGLGSQDLGRQVIQRLEMALAEAETEPDRTKCAWIYRRALDDIYPRLVNQAEPATATETTTLTASR